MQTSAGLPNPQQSSQQSQPPPENEWEAQSKLDLYILDYLKKRDLVQTASAFQREAKVPDKPIGLDTPPQGLLFEWWSVFWELYFARANPQFSEAAATYLQTQKPRHPLPSSHQLQLHQLHQHQYMLHRQKLQEALTRDALLKQQQAQQQAQQQQQLAALQGLPPETVGKLDMLRAQAAGIEARAGLSSHVGPQSQYLAAVMARGGSATPQLQAQMGAGQLAHSGRDLRAEHLQRIGALSMSARSSLARMGSMGSDSPDPMSEGGVSQQASVGLLPPGQQPTPQQQQQQQQQQLGLHHQLQLQQMRQQQQHQQHQHHHQQGHPHHPHHTQQSPHSQQGQPPGLPQLSQAHHAHLHHHAHHPALSGGKPDPAGRQLSGSLDSAYAPGLPPPGRASSMSQEHRQRLASLHRQHVAAQQQQQQQQQQLAMQQQGSGGAPPQQQQSQPSPSPSLSQQSQQQSQQQPQGSQQSQQQPPPQAAASGSQVPPHMAAASSPHPHAGPAAPSWRPPSKVQPDQGPANGGTAAPDSTAPTTSSGGKSRGKGSDPAAPRPIAAGTRSSKRRQSAAADNGNGMAGSPGVQQVPGAGSGGGAGGHHMEQGLHLPGGSMSQYMRDTMRLPSDGGLHDGLGGAPTPLGPYPSMDVGGMGLGGLPDLLDNPGTLDTLLPTEWEEDGMLADQFLAGDGFRQDLAGSGGSGEGKRRKTG